MPRLGCGDSRLAGRWISDDFSMILRKLWTRTAHRQITGPSPETIGAAKDGSTLANLHHPRRRRRKCVRNRVSLASIVDRKESFLGRAPGRIGRDFPRISQKLWTTRRKLTRPSLQTVREAHGGSILTNFRPRRRRSENCIRNRAALAAIRARKESRMASRRISLEFPMILRELWKRTSPIYAATPPEPNRG